MLIDCPGCNRSYHVKPDDLGQRGRTLVCPRCDARWFQEVGEPSGGSRRRELEAAGVSARPSPVLDELPAPSARPFFVPRSAVVTAAVVLGCLSIGGLLIGRQAVVRAMPRAAALYAAAGLPVNVVGLAFAGIAPERLPSTDVTIRGAIRNIAGRRVRVPRLSFEVRDGTGVKVVAWSEAASTTTLPADRELAFASTPHRLPVESRTVLVRFE